MARRLTSDVDTSKLRYFLYARKSTEDKGSQERSIGDQIKDCIALAERDGLHLINPYIKEEKSAKVENNREKFTWMLNQIRKGKADGIVSWHPDRLSRNPLESAQIIDMLDKGIIKDLKFATCQFTNDSSGKMLLNILFAISKQYSEHISEGVIRANDDALEEGKSNGVPKWGYDRGRDGYYYPDDNFSFIRTAWDMKLENKSHTEILKFLQTNNVHRLTKITRKNKTQRPIFPNLNSLATMFADPFYYGVLVQAGQEVNLVEATDGAFVPMVSYEEYSTVQSIGGGRTRGKIIKNRAIFYPLRGLVKCGTCGHLMKPGVSRGHGGRYLYYRCDNKECTRQPRGVRAQVIFDPLFDVIRRLQFSEKDYAVYEAKVNSLTDEKIIEMRSTRKSLEARCAHKKKELSDLMFVAANMKITGNEVAIHQADDNIAAVSNDIADLEIKIKELTDKIDGTREIALSKQEFLNLLKSLPDKIENASIAEKDAIIRIMLLNLTIDDQKRPHFLWKEPFKSLLESQEFLTGARNGT